MQLAAIVDETRAEMLRLDPSAKEILEEIEGILKSVEKITEKATAEAAKIDNLSDTLVGDLQRRVEELSKMVTEEAQKRTETTEEIATETTGMQKAVDNAAILTSHLVEKIGAQVGYSIGRLALDYEEMDKKYDNMVANEQYRDANAIINIKKKDASWKHAIEETDKWKKGTVETSDAWRGKVQRYFAALGHELDMTSLEVDEQKAMEEWAINDLQQELNKKLGAEMEGISALAQSRIAALAESAGKEIAAIMADESLTAEEKAKKIAEVRKRAHAMVLEIIKADARNALEEKHMARHLEVSIKDVEAAMSRIANLEQPTTPTDVKDRTARLQKEIEKATAQMDRSILGGGGYAFVEKESNSNETVPVHPVIEALSDEMKKDRQSVNSDKERIQKLDSLIKHLMF